MQKTLLLVPLFAVACSYPRFVATKTIELEVPLAEATMLDCMTHNGGITVTKVDSSDTIQLRATMEARGYSQDEAEANLGLLSIGQAHEGDTLRIFGEYPRSELRNQTPSFRFEMRVPEHLGVSLTSHNGDIKSHGTTGPVHLETHNGGIDASSRNPKTWAETHNGGIKLALQAAAELDGTVMTHNGGIRIDVNDQASCWLEVDTHNGSINTPSTIRDANIKRSSVRGRLGEAATNGRLQVTTHNGSVVVRTASNGEQNEFK